MPDTSSTLRPGERVGNYQILAMAGAGGMGVVYKALDIKLERTVALKFLPPELNASEKDRERFLKEARTASSLDHPNIGVIHGVEETPDGHAFIVMAFYEGESLTQKIRRGPLPVRDAVDIAIQMAKGLEAAHARNIVHRDVKPSNVLITQHGLAKIVDFGLARVVTSPTMTQTGGTSGTVGYMSPEQSLGKPIDLRTDIWALGVVLAEMLAGQNPFWRDSVPST
ncbi:MAG TPA: serine/threonine-protein kinase, partial [Candidatus Acidoferrales bacterium]|nr:serine/threonine-protein kinase [Candidatus Acidoferrales bacterium]